jgi:alkylated DNA repair dioxygenase AlkB
MNKKFPYKLIDLTHALDSTIPTWNDRCGFNHDMHIDYSDCEGEDKFRVMKVKMHAGIGTHTDSQNWNIELKRRTQHYGYKYDYTARSVDPSYYMEEVPYWVDNLCSKLYSDPIFIEKPDQLIINEYMPGHGLLLISIVYRVLEA